MGTRGIVGFVLDGKEKLTYNHFDSYPECLGRKTLQWLQGHLFDDRARDIVLHPEVIARIAQLKLVDESDRPTDEQREQLARFTDTTVSTGSDWYATLRQCQGDLDLTLKSGYLIDSHEFALDSLFCEWGYVIDIDQQAFEVYGGFNEHETPTSGRWAGVRNPEREAGTRSDGSTYEVENYQPIRLLWSIPFEEALDLDLDEFVERADGLQEAVRQRDDAQATA